MRLAAGDPGPPRAVHASGRCCFCCSSRCGAWWAWCTAPASSTRCHATSAFSCSCRSSSSAVRTETDLRRVLKAMVLAYVLVFPYALRQMLRFGERLGSGLYETNYLATILVMLVPLAFVFASQEREPPRPRAVAGRRPAAGADGVPHLLARRLRRPAGGGRWSSCTAVAGSGAPCGLMLRSCWRRRRAADRRRHPRARHDLPGRRPAAGRARDRPIAPTSRCSGRRSG